jgi:hypothetical protein
LLNDTMKSNQTNSRHCFAVVLLLASLRMRQWRKTNPSPTLARLE